MGDAGAASDREAMAATISGKLSGAQAQGTINTYQELLGSQLHGMHTQYRAGIDPLKTGQDDFNKFIAPETQAVLDRIEKQQGKPGAGRAGAPAGTYVDKRPDPTNLRDGTKYTEDNGNVTAA